jgi:hypothetical protein
VKSNLLEQGATESGSNHLQNIKKAFHLTKHVMIYQQLAQLKTSESKA